MRRGRGRGQSSADLASFVEKKRAARERAQRLRAERSKQSNNASGGGGGGGGGGEGSQGAMTMAQRRHQAEVTGGRTNLSENPFGRPSQARKKHANPFGGGGGGGAQKAHKPLQAPFAQTFAPASSSPAPGSQQQQPQQQQPPQQQQAGHGQGQQAHHKHFEGNPFHRNTPSPSMGGSRPGSARPVVAASSGAASSMPRSQSSTSNTSDGGHAEMSAEAAHKIANLEHQVAELTKANGSLMDFMSRAQAQLAALEDKVRSLERAQEETASTARQAADEASRAAKAASEAATATPASSSSGNSSSRAAVSRLAARKQKAAERARKRRDPSPSESPSQNAIDDTPVGGGRNTAAAIDDMPVGGGSKRSLDDMPVGGRNTAAAIDDMPVGGGNSNSLDELPVGSNSADLPDEYADPGKLKPCKHCGRKFNPGALKKHVKSGVCRKKRKPMNMAARRLQEALEASGGQVPPPSEAARRAERQKKKKKDEVPKWKRDRDALREAMRAGKMIAKAMAEGKDLKDLPPPPTSSVPDDRTPCPHCGRKFNETAAKRHIPKCGEKNKRQAPRRKVRKGPARAKASGRRG